MENKKDFILNLILTIEVVTSVWLTYICLGGVITTAIILFLLGIVSILPGVFSLYYKNKIEHLQIAIGGLYIFTIGLGCISSFMVLNIWIAILYTTICLKSIYEIQ